MTELNPNHPVTQFARDQWHKLCAILMVKMGVKEIEIVIGDLNELAASARKNIVLDTRNDKIVLRLVNDAEANRLARREGGLPT